MKASKALVAFFLAVSLALGAGDGENGSEELNALVKYSERLQIEGKRYAVIYLKADRDLSGERFLVRTIRGENIQCKMAKLPKAVVIGSKKYDWAVAIPRELTGKVSSFSLSKGIHDVEFGISAKIKE